MAQLKCLRFIMRTLPAAILILWVSTTGHAATTFTAATCAQADVIAQIALAADGDTVALPSCSGGATWTSTLTISKAITLQGASCTLDSKARPTSCNTVIIDGVANGSNLIVWHLVANKVSRMTAIEFRDGGVRPYGAPIYFQGQTGGGPLDSRRFRLDHNRFLLLRGWAPWVYAAWGVIDHNYYDLLPGNIGLYFFEPAEFAYADARWAAPTDFGGENFLFVESNTFTRNGNHYALSDAYGGARVVVRYNDIINSWVEAHGTESAARARGTRAMEVYRNTYTGNNTGSIIVNLRSGSALVFDNTATNYRLGTPSAGVLNNERTLGNFQPWNVADGTSPWDVHDPRNPLATFTVSSATVSSVTVLGAGWTTNQWQGYVLHKVGCVSANHDTGPAFTCGAMVESNTATTITLLLINSNASLPLSGGDQFQLNAITHVFDGPCRSGGSLLTAKIIPTLTSSGTTATVTLTNHGYATGDYVAIAEATPADYRGTFRITVTGPDTFTYTLPNTATSPAVGFSGFATKLPSGTNDQITDPCYQWLNTESGNNISFRAGLYALQIRPNEQYYDYTPSFNGTVGVGSGLRANRPGTCRAGVAYWATDEGEWDSTHAGPDGNLYTCTATNTWAVTYTPYTYPHPLTTGAATLMTANPSSGSPGAANLLVSLSGQATHFVNGTTTASFGGGVSGITVNSVTVSSPTSATANISIAGGATPGPRNVTVTTGAEVVTATNGFIVIGLPSLTTIAPNSGSQGATVPVTLTGSQFLSGATVAVSGTGVTVSGVSVTSVTSMTATFTIGAGASPGARNVTVTTAGGTSGAVTFTVNPVSTDAINPTPGSTGLISVTTVTPTGAVLTWTKATDDTTAQASLEYEVRQSSSNNISGVAAAEANGIIIQPYLTDLTSMVVNSLTASTTYYFTVIVKDAAGNKAAYGVATATTMSWGDINPPTVTIVVPYDGDIVKGPAVAILASATDDAGVKSVWFTLDGAPLGAPVTSPPYTINWDTTLVPDGPYTLTANADDNFGRTAIPHSISIRVGNTTTSYAIPPSGGQAFTVNGSTSSTSTVAHARIQGGTNSPTGVAIIDFQTGGTGTPALTAEAQNSSVLLSQAGAAAIVETQSGMAYVDIGPRINTGIAFANETTSQATINYSFTDDQGATVKQGKVDLFPGKQISGFLNAPPYNAPTPFTGTFRFTSTIPLAVIATRNFTNERNEFLFSTMPVATALPTVDPLLPMFADGGGWSTRVILTNESSHAMAGNVEFFGPGSSTAAATPLSLTVNGQTGVIFPYSIPPYSMFRLDTQGLSSAATTSGSVRITSTVVNPLGTNSPNAFAIVSYKTNNVTVTESSVFAVPTGSNFQMFVEYAAGQEKISSGIAVANASATETSVVLELTKLDGSSAGTQTFSLPGKGELSRFLDEFFPTLPGNFRGILRVTSTAPIGVVDLRGRYNSRDEFLVTAMPPVNQSVPVGGAIVFPHLVSGGGYTSQIILFGQPVGSAVGGLSFTLNNGTPIEGAATITP